MIWVNSEAEDGLRAAIEGLASLGVSPTVFRLVVAVAVGDGLKISKASGRMLGMPQADLEQAVETAIKLHLVAYSGGFLKLLDDTGSVYEPKSAATEISGKVKLWPEWYRMYPRKVGKIEAEKAYITLVKKLAKSQYQGRIADAEAYLIGQLKKALESLEAMLTDRGDFRPYPATWLRQRHADY